MQTNFLYVIILLFYIVNFKASYAQSEKSTISTSIQFSSTKSRSAANNTESKNSLVEITPRYTYQVNNRIGFGVFYSHTSGKIQSNTNINFPTINESYTNITLIDNKINGNAGGGFVQYYLLNNSKIKLFSELEAGYGLLKTKFNNHSNITSNELYETLRDRWQQASRDDDGPSIILPTMSLDNVTKESNTKLFSTSFNLGGRYNFYKGLGAEVRLNNLINYSNIKTDDTEESASQVNILNNLFDNISIGISYSF